MTGMTTVEFVIDRLTKFPSSYVALTEQQVGEVLAETKGWIGNGNLEVSPMGGRFYKVRFATGRLP